MPITFSAMKRLKGLCIAKLASAGAMLPSFAQQFVAPQQAVAQRDALRFATICGAGAGVDLGDLDAGGADFVADAAAGAVIDRMVGRLRLAVFAEALRLRADIFRAGEDRSPPPPGSSWCRCCT
jgi:hypothetical protein